MIFHILQYCYLECVNRRRQWLTLFCFKGDSLLPTLLFHMYPIFEPTESTFINFYIFTSMRNAFFNFLWIWKKILLKIREESSIRTAFEQLEFVSMHLCSQKIYQSKPRQNLLIYFQLLKKKSRHLIQEPWTQAQTNKKKQEAGERP